MDTSEKKSKTLPGVAVARTTTLPEISIADLERAMNDEETVDLGEEIELADTAEFPIPVVAGIESDDDFEGPTGVYDLHFLAPDARVYWVQRA